MFGGMKIRWKILLSSCAILLASVLLISGAVVTTIRHNAADEIEQFRVAEMERVEDELKNYLDIAHETVESSYRNALDNTYLQGLYGERLKNIIDLTDHVISEAKAAVAAGSLTLAEAQQRAKEQISRMRYDDGTGYIWINDTGKPYPKMIMHPTVPALDGTVLDSAKYNCALGKKENLFKAFVDVCEREGEGFVDYLWPKPTKDGLSTDQPKLSYVRLDREWGWVVGTGIYVDDAVTDAVAKIKRDLAQMRYDGGTGYFWINDMGKPYPKMVMHPTVPALDGTVLDNAKYNCALGKKENLFNAFVDVCEREGEGFVDYLWPKPTKDGLTAEQPKLSYVRHFEPLGWVIGTGVYIDSIEAGVAAKTEAINQQLRGILLKIGAIVLVILILAFLLLWFVASHIASPLRLCKDFAEEMGRGNLQAKLGIESRDEVGQLASSLKKMQADLKEILGKIFSSSRNVSDGAADQAASIEETSASLEEMAAMTRQNAQSVEEGNLLIGKSRAMAGDAHEAMGRLAGAMKEISAASSETQKIIKTIDEIAFQTNLLALNAAVEAARAGEAGAGFAVVADEVRNLAGRAAAAARETAAMIEKTVKKIEEGDRLTVATEASFSEVIGNITKVSEIMDEITRASSEQASGIAQINQTVSSINNVTMSNMDNAKELSAAVGEFSIEEEGDDEQRSG